MTNELNLRYDLWFLKYKNNHLLWPVLKKYIYYIYIYIYNIKNMKKITWGQIDPNLISQKLWCTWCLYFHFCFVTAALACFPLLQRQAVGRQTLMQNNSVSSEFCGLSPETVSQVKLPFISTFGRRNAPRRLRARTNIGRALSIRAKTTIH